MTYKMKGSPMLRNFGIGSPVRDTDPHTEGHTHKGDKASVSNWIKSDAEYEDLKSTKSGKRKEAIEKRHGGTWENKGQSYDKKGNFTGGWRNENNQTVVEVETSRLDPSKNR